MSNTTDRRPSRPPTRAVTVTPRVDVLETEDEFLILADMPGSNRTTWTSGSRRAN